MLVKPRHFYDDDDVNIHDDDCADDIFDDAVDNIYDDALDDNDDDDNKIFIGELVRCATCRPLRTLMQCWPLSNYHHHCHLRHHCHCCHGHRHDDDEDRHHYYIHSFYKTRVYAACGCWAPVHVGHE